MKTVIIGAGLAGLTAGIKLREKGGDYIILEKTGRPGGMARTEIINGFTFDYTGHFLHLRNPQIEKFIFSFMKMKLNKIKREAYIFSNGVYSDYPYQVNNYGLPIEIIEENLTGFLHAYFKTKNQTENFKEWALQTFGTGIAKNFLFPYNKKLWHYPLQKLTTKWMGRFVPTPTIEEIMTGILPKGRTDVGYNAYFYYPEYGGIESVVKALYENVKDKTILNAETVEVDVENKTVHFNKESVKYDTLLTTMPLNMFLSIIKGDNSLKKYSSKLLATSVYCLNIGFKSEEKINRHWIYVPGEEYIFYRVGFPSAICSSNAPRGMQSVFAEVSFNANIPASIDNAIISGLIGIGIIKNKNDVFLKYSMILPDAYVIYNKERERTLPVIKEKLKGYGILTAGRWGNWEYTSMEDAIIEGMEAAEECFKLNIQGKS